MSLDAFKDVIERGTFDRLNIALCIHYRTGVALLPPVARAAKAE